jgi:hypothetical protein
MNPTRRIRLIAAVVAAVVAITGCGGDDAPDEEATPTAPAQPRPTAEATGDATMVPGTESNEGDAGDIVVDLSALDTDAGLAGGGGDIVVQACLGGQCFDDEVGVDELANTEVTLDTAGLAPGDVVPVTVTVLGSDGSMLFSYDEDVTVPEATTTLTVDPRGD